MLIVKFKVKVKLFEMILFDFLLFKWGFQKWIYF